MSEHKPAHIKNGNVLFAPVVNIADNMFNTLHESALAPHLAPI